MMQGATWRKAWLRVGVLAASVAVLAACGASQRRDDVWDNYDIRNPLPHDSEVSNSNAQILHDNDPYRNQPQYIDNDSYYSMPVIQCGIGDLPACGE